MEKVVTLSSAEGGFLPVERCVPVGEDGPIVEVSLPLSKRGLPLEHVELGFLCLESLGASVLECKLSLHQVPLALLEPRPFQCCVASQPTTSSSNRAEERRDGCKVG